MKGRSRTQAKSTAICPTLCVVFKLYINTISFVKGFLGAGLMLIYLFTVFILKVFQRKSLKKKDFH